VLCAEIMARNRFDKMLKQFTTPESHAKFMSCLFFLLLHYDVGFCLRIVLRFHKIVIPETKALALAYINNTLKAKHCF